MPRIKFLQRIMRKSITSDGSSVSTKPYLGYVSAAIGNTRDDVITAELKGGETYTIICHDDGKGVPE